MPAGEDPIHVSVTLSGKTYRYLLDGRELCYAAAKAYTDALKKYGFYGYYWTTCRNEDGDTIVMHEFLFLKAYALNRLDVRELSTVWKGNKSWQSAEGTPFEKELELLIADMD